MPLLEIIMYIKTSDQAKFELGFGGFQINWGMHLAGLYETEKERDEIIMGFLNQGDKDGDLMLYCPCERTEEDFTEKYDQFCPACAGHTKDPEKFLISSAKELYYPDGTFSPWAMDKGLDSFYKDSQKNGKRNIRATAEMVWALESVPGVEHLMAYESRLNYFIPGKPWISICMYNITKFSGDTIMKVLQTHPYTLSGGVITENPFYQNPDDWLSKNAPEYFKETTT
jgi:hypothetical protein